MTYHIEGDACEIVTLDSQRPGLGIGTALLEATKGAARAAGCRRLWLITTNDNTYALRYYQKMNSRVRLFINKNGYDGNMAARFGVNGAIDRGGAMIRRMLFSVILLLFLLLSTLRPVVFVR